MPLHHYVPQFYLKYFSIASKPGLVWVYRRDNNQPRETNVNRISAVHGFYQVTLVGSGERSEQIEKMFSKIEGDAKPVFDRLIQEKGRISVSEHDYSILSVYMAFQCLRGPSSRARMHNFEKAKVEEEIKEIARDTDRLKAAIEEAGLVGEREVDLESIRTLLLDVDRNFVLERKRGEEGQLISFMVEWARDLCQLIYNKRWSLYESDGGGPFLTSDNPVTLMQPANLSREHIAGFVTGVVALPVCPMRSLLLEPGRRTANLEVVPVVGSRVRQINGSTMLGAHREVYSNISSKKVVKAFGRTKDGAAEELLSATDLPGATHAIDR